MSNRRNLDPDQARHFVGPDLSPNCLQGLSADDTCRQRVKDLLIYKRESIYSKTLFYCNHRGRGQFGQSSLLIDQGMCQLHVDID